MTAPVYLLPLAAGVLVQVAGVELVVSLALAAALAQYLALRTVKTRST
jgi:hypothetical protein